MQDNTLATVSREGQRYFANELKRERCLQCRLYSSRSPAILCLKICVIGSAVKDAQSQLQVRRQNSHLGQNLQKCQKQPLSAYRGEVYDQLWDELAKGPASAFHSGIKNRNTQLAVASLAKPKSYLIVANQLAWLARQ